MAVGDEEFLHALKNGLDQSLDHSPFDLAIYIAGADPFQGDRLGRLGLTKTGLLERDRTVFEYCQDRGLPVAIVMGGGYGRDIEDIVDIHFQTIQLALEMSEKQ